MEDKLDEYIKEHLTKYLKYHLERGYDLLSVKKALMSYGYTSKEIDEIANNIEVRDIKLGGYNPKDIDGETYYFLRGMLADYIKNQEKHGFSKADIKKALIKYGHHPNIVNDAAGMLRAKGSLKINPTFVILMSVIISLFFILMLSGILQVDFKDVFMTFTPALITMFLLYASMPLLKKRKEAAPILSIILSAVLFFLIFPAIKNPSADQNVLLVLNVALSFVMVGLHSMAYNPKK